MLKFAGNSTFCRQQRVQKMLLLAPKRFTLAVTAREVSSTSDEQGQKSSSGGAFFKTAALVGTASIVGGLAWAYYDPETRKKVENLVPQTKSIFDTLYGFVGQTQQKIQSKIPTEKPKSEPKIEIKKKESLPPAMPVDETAKIKLTTIAELSPQPSAIPASKKEAKLIEIHPVDVHVEAPKIEIKKETAKELKVDKEFESRLFSALDEAGKKSEAAKVAKLRTIQALKQHSKLLKEAVDSGVRKEDDPKLWDGVKSAQAEVEKCADRDRTEEGVARDAIDELKKMISVGKLNGKHIPLLPNAQETANKLADRLDELNLMLNREQAQSRIFTNYRELVDQGRKQWADELKSVFPDIDLRAKEGRLTQEELDAFIVHANLRIEQLRRQLAEYQVQEEQRIAEALEEQRQLDESLSKATLDYELRRIRNNAGMDLDERVAEERKLWEAEQEAHLKRAALAHAEHLERVIKTQKQIHDVENAQFVEEAVNIERNKYAKQIDTAVTKLNAIEEALNSRAAQDLVNRRSKIYWTICQTLLDSLVNGDGSGSETTPLKEVALIKQLTDEQDTFAQSVCNCFPPRALERGVPTEQGLKKRFNKVHKLAFRTAQIDDNGGGPLKYLASWLQSLVMFRLPVACSAEDRLDTANYDPYDLLDRIHCFVVERGDLHNAIRVANLLRGEPARIFRDWLADARFHLEVRYLVDCLFANAQAAGIRTIY